MVGVFSWSFLAAWPMRPQCFVFGFTFCLRSPTCTASPVRTSMYLSIQMDSHRVVHVLLDPSPGTNPVS